MTNEEKEGRGWILDGATPREIVYVSGFAPADGFPYVLEKGTGRSIMGRVHPTKAALLEAVEKDFNERIALKRAEAANLRAQLKSIRRAFIFGKGELN